MKESIKTRNSTLFSPTDRECQVVLNSDTLSSQFLTALPNATGIMPDKILIEVFAHYMGLPSPAMKPFNATPHYIGRDGQQIDQYGDAVARARLCGGDWQRSHYDLQYLLADIMRKGCLSVDVEAQNMFSNIVPEDIHREYQRSHTRKDAIIPDMLVHNYLPDVNANGKCSMPAIFDVKTLRVDKNLVIYNQGKGGKKVVRAVKKRVRSTRLSYLNRAKQLDEKLAAGDDSKPFATALTSQFHSGGVIPLVFGTYAEANKETHELIKFCARTAAAHEHNARISPEDLDSSRGSPFQLLLNQFRKAVGVLCIRNVVEEKLRRIMYIRPTKEGAKAAANTSNRRNNARTRHGPSWYNNFRNNETFDAFYAFSSKYDDFGGHDGFGVDEGKF